jgi:integrase
VNYRHSLTPLLKLYSRFPATKFGASDLRAVQAQMVADGLCRNVVNRRLDRVRSLFRWGVSYQHLVNEKNEPNTGLLVALDTLDGLSYGAARESKPVEPAPDDLVQATLPHLSPTVQAMVRLQSITGMRSSEICLMRGCDIDTRADATGQTWDYKPHQHKNLHRGITRTVVLGPECQRIVRPFLKTDVQAYLFSPSDAEHDRREAAQKARKTPLSCGNTPTTDHRRKGKRAPRDHFDKASYCHAVGRACRKAFPPPSHLSRLRLPAGGRKKKATRQESRREWKTRLGPELWAELIAWEKAHHWHPHQIRHAVATRVDREHGIEASSIALGHEKIDTTKLYAQRDLAAYRRRMVVASR